MVIPRTEAVLSDFQDLCFVSLLLVFLVMLFLIRPQSSSVVSHESWQFRQLKFHMLIPHIWRPSYVLLFSFHILKVILCLGILLVYTTESVFNILSSVIVMFLFSIIFWYLFSYPSFFSCCNQWKTASNLNFSWKYTVDYLVYVFAVNSINSLMIIKVFFNRMLFF
jgi:hypothetical protein